MYKLQTPQISQNALCVAKWKVRVACRYAIIISDISSSAPQPSNQPCTNWCRWHANCVTSKWPEFFRFKLADFRFPCDDAASWSQQGLCFLCEIYSLDGIIPLHTYNVDASHKAGINYTMCRMDCQRNLPAFHMIAGNFAEFYVSAVFMACLYMPLIGVDCSVNSCGKPAAPSPDYLTPIRLADWNAKLVPESVRQFAGSFFAVQRDHYE